MKHSQAQCIIAAYAWHKGRMVQVNHLGLTTVTPADQLRPSLGVQAHPSRGHLLSDMFAQLTAGMHQKRAHRALQNDVKSIVALHQLKTTCIMNKNAKPCPHRHGGCTRQGRC